MQVRAGTQWCPDCGFQQLVPEIHPPVAGRVSLLAAGGTPVAGSAAHGPSRAGVLSLVAVLVLVAGMLLIGLSPDEEEAAAEEVSAQPFGLLPPAEETVPAEAGLTAEEKADRWARREARKAMKALEAGQPLDLPVDLPTDAPTDLPTEIPTEIPTEVPTALPIPTETAAPVPTAPKTPKPPKAPKTPKPTPAPPAAPPVVTPPTVNPPEQPTPTPARPPAPAPTPSPAPVPPAPPTQAPPPPPATPAPTPKTATEIAQSLSGRQDCGSIKAAGYGYDVAEAYWIVRTNRSVWWDLNRDGRVCEWEYRR